MLTTLIKVPKNDQRDFQKTDQGKQQKILYMIALAAMTAFCVAMSIGGVSSYVNVLYELAKENTTGFDGLSPARFTAVVSDVLLCGVYIFWLTRNWEAPSRFIDIVRLSLPFLVINFLTYPLTSDVYSYLQYGFMALNDVNPYTVPSFGFDSIILPFVYWPQTSTYGPISLLFFMISAAAAPIHIFLAVYIFKIFCVLFHVFNAGLIWRLLEHLSNRNLITIAYLLNPVLLVSHIADAHVDVLLGTTMILMIGCLYRRQYVMALLSLFAGFLTKTLPIIWFPLIVNFLIRRRRWKALAIAAAIGIAVAMALSTSLFPSIAAWKSLVNPGVNGQTARSIHHLVNLLLLHFAGMTEADWASTATTVARISYIGFGVYYLWLLLQAYRKPGYSEENLVNDIGWATVALFLFATPWVMPWYPSALLPIAFLAVSPELFLVSLTYGLTASIVVGPASGKTAISILGSLLTIAPAMLLLKFSDRLPQGFLKQLSRRSESS